VPRSPILIKAAPDFHLLSIDAVSGLTCRSAIASEVLAQGPYVVAGVGFEPTTEQPRPQPEIQHEYSANNQSNTRSISNQFFQSMKSSHSACLSLSVFVTSCHTSFTCLINYNIYSIMIGTPLQHCYL